MADKKNIYSSIFGKDPATQQAAVQRDTAFQSWLNTRKQAAEQQRTSDVNMAKYNALGNILTTMVQPIGWAVGGKGQTTGSYQPYDNRQYLEAFNRAVKASDDLRNIGSAEHEYQFKLADENYKRQLALEDEARKRDASRDDLEYKAQQRINEIQQKFENDMAKQERRAELQLQLAEFNATHRIKQNSTGLNINDRMKLQLLKDYGVHRKNAESYNETPLSYPEWLKSTGYSFSDNTASTGTGSGDGVDIGL